MESGIMHGCISVCQQQKAYSKRKNEAVCGKICSDSVNNKVIVEYNEK